MRKPLIIMLFLLSVSLSSAFSMLSYYNDVNVQEDGSILVYEKMEFYLDAQYNEGYRSIRPQDFDSLSDITVNSVKVNGKTPVYEKKVNGQDAEIIWKNPPKGESTVELNYTIKNRVELFDDFARLCYEHYGANWKTFAREFTARTTLPPKSANKTMHFEIYSTEKGKAYVDNLSIIIEMEDVPSGNYVGGCYLFDKGAVSGNLKTVNSSAYAILKKEREVYGSQTVLEAEKPNLGWCCLPIFILSLLLSAYFYIKQRKKPAQLQESILPPEKEEEPAIVTALVRNKYDVKELVAATIVSLISRNIIDIVELEKKESIGAEIKRERTILFLKKRPNNLKNYENSVLDFLFAEGNEIDLDAKMKNYEKISNKTEAEKIHIVKSMEKFTNAFPGQIEELFVDEEIHALSTAKLNVSGEIAFCWFLGLFVIIFGLSFASISFDLDWYPQHGEQFWLLIIGGCIIGTLLPAIYVSYLHTKPVAPKTEKNGLLYAQWEAFYRGLKSSQIKKYPPASAVIWGRILTYATALGMADKVEKHLSELEPLFAKKIKKIDNIALTSMAYYSSSMGMYNLATFGNRSGIQRSGGHGGFSSHSSGGWSRGGGGFSGGSSGGGGFR